MPSTMLKSLAEATTPLEVGSYSFDEHGKFHHRDVAGFDFTFVHLGIRFSAELKRDVGSATLRVFGFLGYRPFSAESRQRRVDLDHVIRETAAQGTGRLVVGPSQDLHFYGEVPVDQPITPASLIAAATEIVISGRDLIGLGRLLANLPK